LADEILGKQQVVIKPLAETLGRVRGVSGGAVLGDGRVGLILDVNALAGWHEAAFAQ
jgi:two-component system chemotaxis sensor kinase CheA